ncbi:hypothetical protein [Aequorivita vladivostokensis]|uniref:Uncharacterized protein n=1 Tax=Aequorivita vladivostokensis TaxID=171194 RepID=A0ABR5DFC3_9FLAO|nr:hypothetical protein [Aequorivita vladivostokensis]KJJ37463.1 hypothetical protein MB09_13890 [Aequorivita vladivostokensis]MAB56562.1 hypothetical protein [Aequorivita sp.]MDX1783816.1 hypothetical protein [Aequorivita vladivostokensis]HBL80506.1 hypothetical protein [Aequorivita sp.]
MRKGTAISYILDAHLFKYIIVVIMGMAFLLAILSIIFYSTVLIKGKSTESSQTTHITENHIQS